MRARIGARERVMIVRQSEPGDAAIIVALINKAFEVERFFVDGDRTSAAEVTALMAKGAFLVAEDSQGRLGGCVYIEPRPDDRGYIGLLAVDPSTQGAGVGSLLMDSAERRLRERGARSIDISVVNLRLELPPFYEHRGYRAVRTAPFTNPRATRPCHFIIMSKSLADASWSA